MGSPRIMLVVGTRPNFMKMAPVARELERRDFEIALVHTGQHFDDEMSRVFLEELGIGEPDFQLGAGSGTHGQQLARIVGRLEPILLEQRPDLVLVAGDVNSTLAGALAAVAAGVELGHVEAGLRSFDRTMPEEVNRVLVDAVSSLLFIHSPEARENLLREGRDERSIHDVGNTMIDTLVALKPRIDAVDAPARHGLERGGYVVATLHRPALVDGPLLAEAIAGLERLSRDCVVVFPVHPRTRAAIEQLGLDVAGERLRLLPPLGYVEFLGLVAGSAAVVTDSGGIQEETTFLDIPCFTLRDRTERPITETLGTNVVLGVDPSRIPDVPRLIESVRARARRVPPLWDGRAAERIVDTIQERIRDSRPAARRRPLVGHDGSRASLASN